MSADATVLTGLAAVPIGQLRPSPNNPRENLTGIDDLAASIRENGLIQPLVVQRIPGHSGYQIIAGHRRYAACDKLGMTRVPVIIRRDMLPDEELLAMLVENGQRAGLDPIEEARALNRLKKSGVADQEIARKIGRSQSYVSGRLALLALPVEEQEQLRAGTGLSITAAVSKARTDAGKVKTPKNGRSSPVHLGPLHGLAGKAQARCQRLHPDRKRRVGGTACGECWESVIRADERTHLHRVSDDQGRCVLCDTTHDPDGGGAS